MNKRNYDRRVIQLFDILGSYFVDFYYNHHYLFAKDLVEQGKTKSITDAYKSTVHNYVRGVGSKHNIYTQQIKQLHAYYQSKTSALTFADFENKIVSLFIPPEYFDDFTSAQKDSTLHQIIVKTITEFSLTVLRPEMLVKIIDHHTDKSNIELLQNRIVDIFLIQREEYYASFTSEIVKGSGFNEQTKLIDKLQTGYNEERSKRLAAEKDKTLAAKIMAKLNARITELENENKLLKTKKSQPTNFSPTAPSPKIPQKQSSDSSKVIITEGPSSDDESSESNNQNSGDHNSEDSDPGFG